MDFIRFSDPVRYQTMRLDFYAKEHRETKDFATETDWTDKKRQRANKCFLHATGMLRIIHGGPTLNEKDNFLDPDADSSLL